MQNDNYSQPYRNLGFDKIDAPNKKGKNEPKAMNQCFFITASLPYGDTMFIITQRALFFKK